MCVLDSSGASKYIDNSGIFSDHCYSVCSMKQPDIKFSENRGKTTFWGLVLQFFTKCVMLLFIEVNRIQNKERVISERCCDLICLRLVEGCLIVEIEIEFSK